MVLVGFARGALTLAGGALATLSAFFISDRLTDMPAFVRALLSAGFTIVFVALLYARVLVRLSRPAKLTDAASALEASHERLSGLALSAAELTVAPESHSSAPSADSWT
jgi:hypothetical protein